MMRFRLKAEEVEAEPYRLGLEDAFTRSSVPVLLTPAGRIALSQGDWIVTRGNGEREVVKAHEFTALYERCPDGAGPQVSERVRRGIPLRSG